MEEARYLTDPGGPGLSKSVCHGGNVFCYRSSRGSCIEPYELHVLFVLIEDIVDQLAVSIAHHVVALATLAQVHIEPVVDVAVA
jgi:hypothetical protein